MECTRDGDASRTDGCDTDDGTTTDGVHHRRGRDGDRDAARTIDDDRTDECDGKAGDSTTRASPPRRFSPRGDGKCNIL